MASSYVWNYKGNPSSEGNLLRGYIEKGEGRGIKGTVVDIGRRIELEDERPFVIVMLTLVEIIELRF